MNKDKVRKYMADIQIAMGKILEEMNGFKEVASEFKDFDNLSEHTEGLIEDLGISKKEASTITNILKNTETKQVDIEELIEEDNSADEGLTEEDIAERAAYNDMGVEWIDPRVKINYRKK